MIPPVILEQSAMLASPGTKLAPDAPTQLERLLKGDDHYFDIKWDGIRALAYVEDNKVWLRNRRSVDITYRYPDLIDVLKAAVPSGTVLDGEVICLTNGEPDFSKIHRRDAQQNPRSAASLAERLPATYMAFDILYRDDDLRGLPYAARRRLLEAAVRRQPDAKGSNVLLSTSSLDGKAMYDEIVSRRLEGLIAKTATGQYRAGRSQTWIKIKPTKTVTAIGMGYDLGDNALSHTIGAVHLVLLDADNEPVKIGKVGSGFKIPERDEIKARMDNGEMLLFEVEYQEVSPNGQLRFPSYKGLRTDLTVLDATVDQLHLTEV